MQSPSAAPAERERIDRGELEEALACAQRVRINVEMVEPMLRGQGRNLRWETASDIGRVESMVGASNTRTGRILHLLTRELERDFVAPFAATAGAPFWGEQQERWEATKAATLTEAPR